MGRVRMGDGQGKTTLIRHAGQINRLAKAMFGNHGGKAASAGCGFQGKGIGAVGLLDQSRL